MPSTSSPGRLFSQNVLCFFPELLPWASWCYGSQPYLWHPLGHLTSESGVQQGDPLGPLFFSLVLHKVIAAIDADDDCLRLILQAWYLDDGVLAGSKHAVLRALSIIEDLGPSLGIFINSSECELFSHSDISMFHHVMKASHVPHLDILGTPIGDYLYCTGFFAAKRVEFTKLLSKLEDVSVIDPQVAFNMLRLCSGFYNHHLMNAVNLFNSLVSSSASSANKARLLSESASHAAAWLSVVPSIELGLHLEPNEYQVAVRWWLGLDTSGTAFCPGVGLDPLGHHCVTCRHGGDVVWRHNLLREAIASLCRTAHLSTAVEKGGGGHDHTRPADVLIAEWDRGKHAALDITVASPLCPAILPEASHHSGAAANGAELRKLNANSTKCTELGWTCIPMAVETFGHWGREAQSVLSRLASHLSISLSQPRAAVVADIYGRLNIILPSTPESSLPTSPQSRSLRPQYSQSSPFLSSPSSLPNSQQLPTPPVVTDQTTAFVSRIVRITREPTDLVIHNFTTPFPTPASHTAPPTICN
ncbi:hypothetical protein EMCRGX_G024351 [Ephydatia muelleri]